MLTRPSVCFYWDNHFKLLSTIRLPFGHRVHLGLTDKAFDIVSSSEHISSSSSSFHPFQRECSKSKRILQNWIRRRSINSSLLSSDCHWFLSPFCLTLTREHYLKGNYGWPPQWDILFCKIVNIVSIIKNSWSKLASTRRSEPSLFSKCSLHLPNLTTLTKLSETSQTWKIILNKVGECKS
jgi:hypothetical protein